MSAWESIGRQRRAGVLVPLFFVYSQNSTGIGDFGDLKLLVDWATKTGNSIVQLLPMNEMGGLFCPYDALSGFALEPVCLSLRNLIPPKKISQLQKLFPTGKKNLSYGIKEAKLCALREIYQETKSKKKLEVFRQENSYWLADFVLFKVLKNYYQGRPWYEWEERHKNRNQQALEGFRRAHQEEIEFQEWLQWLAYEQFKEAKDYAAKTKILLKGDLPILVSRDSADVWAHPEFFKLELASGAPPDMYCSKGQRWGMPTYNWENIVRDDYGYLKEKLRYAQNFYDILRIDHVVGLFRIWSIPYQEPLENQGLNGFFDPQDEGLWETHGRNILSIIVNNTRMLICAEDLGIIPQACPATLEDLGIPGNDVQRWRKDWDGNKDFLEPDEYRKLSVAMLSTHDTSNWPAWWENEATLDEKNELWRKFRMPGLPQKHCNRKLAAGALNFTLGSQSIFCIQSIIDWLYLGDIFKGDPYRYRINTPGTISKDNWSLVMPLSLEELLKHKVSVEINKMIVASGRDT